MLSFLSITKSLADESRLRILMALNGRELCVCQITELLGLASSTVSKHMAILTQARLVKNRKDGRWRYYCLADDEAPPEARDAISWVFRSLSTVDRVRQDAVKLEEILALDPEDLCRIQSGS
ncbi:ArsR/SmtB family transcription factor [Thermodesulfobacteriota bacterium]